MPEFGILLFSVTKLMSVIPSDVFGFGLLFLLIFLIYHKSKFTSLVYVFVVLSNSAYALLLANIFLMALVIFSCLARNRFNKYFAYMNVMFVILFIQTLINYNSFHDLLRWCILYSSFGVLFSCSILRDDSYLDNASWLYVSMIGINFIYLTMLSDNDRLSVFTGSENIALMLFFFIGFLAWYKKNYLPLLFTILFLINIESRSLVLLPVAFFTINLILTKSSKFKTLSIYVVAIGLMCVSVIYNPELRVSRALNDSIDIVSSDNVEQLAKIDTRGILIVEGISKLKEKPLLGHGVIKPDFFKIYEPDVAMVTYHNAIIDVLVTYGFVGLLIFILLVWIMFKYIRDYCESYALLLFFVCIIMSVIQPYFFNIQVMSLLFVTMLQLKEKHE